MTKTNMLIILSGLPARLFYGMEVFRVCRDSVYGKDGFHGISRKDYKKIRVLSVLNHEILALSEVGGRIEKSLITAILRESE